MLRNKQILIFDEPLAYLDEISKEKLINIINMLKDNHIVIVITHDNFFDDISDNIFELPKYRLF